MKKSVYLFKMEPEMSNMKIYTYPAVVLKSTAEPIENIDENLQKIIDQMFETMYAAPGMGWRPTRSVCSKGSSFLMLLQGKMNPAPMF
jgi:hypothetical protein